MSAIPVIMLTMMDDKKRGYALGAANYITKPIDLDETLARFSETDCHLVAWLDCLSAGRRALVTRARIAPESAETPAARKDQPRRVPCDAPSSLLNPASVRLYNTIHFHHERRHSRA